MIWTARGESREHVEFARYLISRGARVDVQSTDKQYTALHFASKYAGKEMVSVLIAAGAPVNAGPAAPLPRRARPSQASSHDARP